MAALVTKYPKKPVEDWLLEVDYEFVGYMPKAEALLFVNFIKEVNGGSEENETPIVHLKMMDTVFNDDKRCAILCHRGIGKTTLFGEYLILFIAAFGYFPGFGIANLILYVTDSIENGVKNLRRNVEHRYSNSEFLQRLIPNKKISIGTNGAGFVSTEDYEAQSAAGHKFTDIRLEFVNNKGHKTVVKGYGAKTGVRGAKEMGIRPSIAILDDLVSDTDAESATVIRTIENTVYKAVSKALHPTKQKIVWLGTPFNARDPLYKAVESGAWRVSVYPICERFPVEREVFRGSWEDRFTYEYVFDEHNEAQAVGLPENFNQELMLRIMSDEDRLIADFEIGWYKRNSVLLNRGRFNFYITTDFAVSEKASSDYSVISVWALNSKGFWFWVDGICRKQLMDQNIKDLFRLAQLYKPQQVGIEISGQQRGFISWIQDQMIVRNNFFSLASENNEGNPGIMPNTNKLVRFNIMLPYYKANMMYFPEEMRNTPPMLEMLDETQLASKSGFKSKHDDFLDTVSMLGSMTIWKPSEDIPMVKNEAGIYEEEIEEEDDCALESYVV